MSTLSSPVFLILNAVGLLVGIGGAAAAIRALIHARESSWPGSWPVFLVVGTSLGLIPNVCYLVSFGSAFIFLLDLVGAGLVLVGLATLEIPKEVRHGH